MDGGAEVDGHGGDGSTPVMTVAMFNRMDIVDLLLDAGADPARRDGRGVTAQDLAEHMNAPDASVRLAGVKAGPPEQAHPGPRIPGRCGG